MSLVTKYSESPVRLMENQKLVEIQFPNTATEIIGLNTDNLTKIDVSKCSKDFVNTVKSNYSEKPNNVGSSIKVKEQPNNEIWYTASEKLSETITDSESGLHTTSFGITMLSHIFVDGKGVITFDGDVTKIGNSAFYNCSGLTSVTIPDSVTLIGYCAFYNCSGLTSVTIPDSVTYINWMSFWGCIGLTSIDIPDSVIGIGHNAFQKCSGLTSVTIPDSVTYIEYDTFRSCSKLSSVTIGNRVIDIQSNAFNGCSGLTSMTIPNSVKSIGYSAFSWCSGLTSINIPDSVTEIGDEAFYGCSKLTSVSYKGTIYTSKSAIETALSSNSVMIYLNSFKNTKLT